MGFEALLPLITSGVGLLGGLFGGNKSKQAGQAASKGATLQDILPQLMAMMSQQQGTNSQNYQMQQRKALLTDPGAASIYGGQAPQGAVPLQEALARMAYSLLPTSARQGLGQPQQGGPAPLAMPPMGQTAMPRQRPGVMGQMA